MNIKVLYVGQLFDGSTALHRADALERLGANIVRVDSTRQRGLAERAVNKIWKNLSGAQTGEISLNRNIQNLIKSQPFDLLWIDKGMQIGSDTLRLFKTLNPGARSVHYSPDDMLNPDNQSPKYLLSVPLYDLHVTTKSYNVEELKKIGAKDVMMVGNAYAPELHRRIALSADEVQYFGASVAFIGAFEADRAEMILRLTAAGCSVRVWGKGWRKWQNKHPRLEVVPETLMGENYVKVLNATEINLCFLRKVNRDLQTTRTMEIPACGGFMLAERTTEHQELFEEGTEAVFFTTAEELIEKVKFYTANPDKRRQIAAAGYRRCLISGYSNDERLKRVFTYLFTKQFAERNSQNV